MNRVRQVLLASGAAASLLYAATDIAGGLQYPGYSFTSQAISELMANGAPSERLVDPLFLIYDVLMLAFAVYLVREAAGRGRALQTTGILLSVYALLGVAGPTLFEMQPRGTGSLGGDAPHLVLTAAIVLCLLCAIAFSALALGKAFRAYALVTLAIVIAFGAFTGPFATRLAAGDPTPGLGTIERIMVYASLLWVAVLSVALLRAPKAPAAGCLTAG
jgi:hypothetical membrane protein